MYRLPRSTVGVLAHLFGSLAERNHSIDDCKGAYKDRLISSSYRHSPASSGSAAYPGRLPAQESACSQTHDADVARPHR